LINTITTGRCPTSLRAWFQELAQVWTATLEQAKVFFTLHLHVAILNLPSWCCAGCW